MARIATPGMGRVRPIYNQGDAPTPDFSLKRIGTGVQEDPPPMRPFTPVSLADERDRLGPPSNDALIRRDGAPQLLLANYQPAGRQVNDWTGAGPARPTVWTERGQTLSPRSGVSQSRFYQNPAAPGTGLHTAVNNDASGSIGSAGRYTDPEVPQQRGRRQNRLLPAAYSGQSYSQTTQVQGQAVRMRVAINQTMQGAR